MLSQKNINRALTERALAKTAGAAHMSKYAENWFTANNNSNLKNVGVGAGVGLATGAGAYALGGLIPGLKKKRLARAMMALGVGGAAGGAAGYYGTDIRNNAKDLYYGAKNMSAADGQFRQTLQERRAARAADKAERQAQADAMKYSSTPEHIQSVIDNEASRAQDKADNALVARDVAEADAYEGPAAEQERAEEAQGSSKTGSFRGYHPSRNLYMNKRAGLWNGAKETLGTLKAHFGVGQPDYSTRIEGPTTTTQYGFAGPATAEEIAAASKGKKTKEDVQAWLDRTKSGKQYPGSGNWFTANNNSNLKDIGIGVGTGALTYGATGLIPSLKKKRLTRALIALTAGGAAGYYGSNMRGQA